MINLKQSIAMVWYTLRADYPLRIEQMSEQQIAALEKRLRSGNETEKGSREGFLSETDSLRGIIEQDAATLQRVGISYDSFAKQLEERLAEKQVRMGSMGKQYCPWGCGVYSSGGALLRDQEQEREWSDLSLRIKAGEDVDCSQMKAPRIISDLLPHIIGVHHFFEGNTVYRVEPERLLAYMGRSI